MRISDFRNRLRSASFSMESFIKLVEFVEVTDVDSEIPYEETLHEFVVKVFLGRAVFVGSEIKL